MLIERGADVAAQDKVGETPLHLASRNGEEEVARMLIECGADVAAQNKDGETPLHRASQKGKVEVTRMLIECGADVSAQTKHGETPLHLASKRPSYGIQLQGLAEVSCILLGRGADVNAKNKDGLTSFCLASQNRDGRDPRLKVLLDHGADLVVYPPLLLSPLRAGRGVSTPTLHSHLVGDRKAKALPHVIQAHTLV